MKKILFIYLVELYGTHKYPLFSNKYYHMGISSLSAVLKKNNYETDVLIIDHKTSFTRILKKIKSYSPDLIGYSVDNYGIARMIEIAKTIKSSFPSIFQLAGGVTPSLSPHLFSGTAFNAICVGEGEEALVELLDAINKNVSIDNILNISVNANGIISRPPTRPFIQNLDQLPIIDRQLWEPYLLVSSDAQIVYTGRGCPYKCNYCANSYLQEVACGKYSRNRSVDNILSEIEFLISTYPNLKKIHLESEIFNLDLNFSVSLCHALQALNSKRTTPISFGTNLRVIPNQNYNLLFKSMHNAGFEYFFVGLESGSYRIRKNILNRLYTNIDLMTLAHAAHQNKLDIFTHNMIGIPTEKKEDFIKTIALNRIIRSKMQALHVYTTYDYTKIPHATDSGIKPKTHRDFFRLKKLRLPALFFPYLINRRKNPWIKSFFYNAAVGFRFSRKVITSYLRLKFFGARLMKSNRFHSSEMYYGKK